MARLKILRWFGIICFSLIATVVLGSASSASTSARSSMELGSDGCTLYTAEGVRITRFDICANRPLADFNLTPLPDENGAQQLQVLSDGSVLVANVSVIALFDAKGNLTRTYDSAGYDCWSGIVMEKDEKAFWASSSCGEGVLRFELSGGTPAVNADSRMFGGGSTATTAGVLVHHGMDLHCDTSVAPNILQVVWGNGNIFFMENMTSVTCTGSPFNTINGAGAGTINGQSGARVEFTFADNAPIGVLKDTAQITIRNAAGEVVLQTSGVISAGSHIARE